MLNDNGLSGTIPAEIGDLTALTHLWLVRNELTGCIPVALKNIRNHDLASLDLIYCPSVLVSNANPQEGDEVELRVEVEGATSYQWQVKQNDTWTDVAGETAATYTVTHQTAGDRTYRVVLTGSSGADYNSDDVTVTWAVRDHAGIIKLSSQPHVGTQIRATLTDANGGITGEIWSWERSTDQTTWTAISSADAPSYTPVTGDLNHYLRTTVSYDDSYGPGKSAQAVSETAVQPAVFDPDAKYRVLTRYRRTTELELTDYLAQGVTGISFTLLSCDDARADYYDSVSVEGTTMVLVSNRLGHLHGANTQRETVCTVKGTGMGLTQDREFRFYSEASRRPWPMQERSRRPWPTSWPWWRPATPR